jgi:rod shape-determining protein MreD
MIYLAAPLFILLAFLLQENISVISVAPNLTALLAYYAGIKYGDMKGLAAGMLIGALEDTMASPMLGPNMLGKGMIGFFSSFFISDRIFVWTPLLGMLGAAVLTLMNNAIVFFSLGIFHGLPARPSTALYISVMQSVLNALAGIFIRPAHAD